MDNDPVPNKSDSDISSALDVEMDPQNIEVEESPKSVFIGKNNWRKFLLGATISLLFVTLFMMAYTIIYFIDDRIFRHIFKGFSRVTNPFPILSYIIFIVSLAVPSVWTNIGRKAAIPLMIVIIGCYAYIPAFLFRWGIKEKYKFAPDLAVVYFMWISCVIGLFVNVISTKKVFKTTTGVLVATGLFVVLLAIYILILKMMNPYKYILLILVGLNYGFALYLNLDVKFMLEKRNDYYLTTDWFIGFVHLQTDIFFRFWRDIFRKNVDYIDTSNVNGKSAVLTSAIQKSKLTSIPEDSDENDDNDDANNAAKQKEENNV